MTVTVEKEKSEGGPGTGDNSNIILWIAVLFVSGGVLGMLMIKRMRKKQR